ncbi:hypothetical protein T439DRAFT_355122 [Meredithblackwellia eburnea MCA 4105]
MSSSTATSLTRLYVGNLPLSVTEYDLIQLCSKYGKIRKLDFLFHKTGPSKGKPRGYAFVEFSNKDEALRAVAALNERVVRGRTLVVTKASEQNPDNMGKPRTHSHADPGRPTAISLLKGQGVAANAKTTGSKIAALEAKLAALRKDKTDSSPSGSRPTSTPASPHPDAGLGLEASTSKIPDGEEWLDGVLGDVSTTEATSGVSSKRPPPEHEERDAWRAEEKLAEVEESDEIRGRKRQRFEENLKKAGLPAKPLSGNEDTR